MPKRYEYLSNGVVYGPVTGKEVRRLAAAGQIGPDDLIRAVGADGSEDWVRADKVRGLQFAKSPSVDIDPAAPSRPAGADAPAGPAPHGPSDSLPAPDPFAEIEVDPPAHSRRKYGVAARESALAVLYSFLGFLWACPVGFASMHMISGEQDNMLMMLNLGLGCLFILFASILLRSFHLRLWLGVWLLILPCLGIALVGVSK